MMKPTAYFQYVRRDTAAPCMVLQQWWTSAPDSPLGNGPGCIARMFRGIPIYVVGEWRDVPVVEPEQPKG